MNVLDSMMRSTEAEDDPRRSTSYDRRSSRNLEEAKHNDIEEVIYSVPYQNMINVMIHRHYPFGSRH